MSERCRACHAPRPERYGIPDPCLGWLPSLADACCGHGYDGHCYLQAGGRVLRGREARAELIRLGGNPAPLRPGMRTDGGWEQEDSNG